MDASLDAVDGLTDPAQRDGLLARFIAFHLPAEEALASHLGGIDGLDFEARSRARSRHAGAAAGERIAFPRPETRAEALGLFYVVEGATLGGHVILRELARRGVADDALLFLDPYGTETGRRWRQFLEVLESEAMDETSLMQAGAGAVRGFSHAERVLCGRDS